MPEERAPYAHGPSPPEPAPYAGAPWRTTGANAGTPEQVDLPAQLVRALLLRGLSEPQGRALWLGYTLGQERAPWLRNGTFAIGDCGATVVHVQQGPEAPGSPSGGPAPVGQDGAVPSPG